MSAFRFRLKTLLRLREAARDEQRGHLAVAYSAEQKLLERRQTVDGELTALKAVCKQSSSPGAVNIDRLLDANRYELILKGEMRVIDQHVAALAAEIEKRRQALVAADREVRLLEKLREKQHDRHRLVEAAQDNKRLDEVASQQFWREDGL